VGVELEPFRRGDTWAVAGVLARAFLDDPVWTRIGPRRRGHRRLSNRASFTGIVTGSHRNGARMRVARSGGEVVGVTISFEPGRWPLPEAAALWELGWVLAAGPGPALRGMRDDRAMRERHPSYPHLYLWFIGVDPDRHGAGVGTALMDDVHARADELGLPTYLETGTESNVAFYRSFGYEVPGELRLPSGSPMWLMERPKRDRPAADRPPAAGHDVSRPAPGSG
jgi:GNAT superfamily N-acetyltransferase